MQITGLAAIVTGGASGLGAATARALAAAGAKVTVVDLNQDGVDAVAREIGGLGLRLDVTDAAAAEAAFAQAREAHGTVRVMVNCAGVAPAQKVVGRNGPVALEDFARAVNINLVGTFNMARLAAAEMIAAEPLNEDGERGLIVNTASIAAFEGQIGQAAYAASKGGVASLTLPLAREFAGRGVRVNALAPGIFGTPMLYGLPEAAQESLGKSVPFPSRLGKPEEFAKLVMAIVDNTMINGEVIRIDGALRMGPK